MSKEEIKEYLKNALKIKWATSGKCGDDLYIALTLDGEVISKIPFAQD
mgnify:CR=1 FL=1